MKMTVHRKVGWRMRYVIQLGHFNNPFRQIYLFNRKFDCKALDEPCAIPGIG